jgi:hypothetical protein
MKKCSSCKMDKPTTEFHRNVGRKDGLQRNCKSCSNNRNKQYYLDNRARLDDDNKERRAVRRKLARDYIFDYFGSHPCVDCGTIDVRVLEFDHLPDFKKKSGVGKLAISGYSLDVIKTEIEKCEVRCRNCHIIKTYERSGGSWHDDYLETI